MKNYIEYDGQVLPLDHNVGDIVYIKTDVSQSPCMITGYQFRGTSIVYLVSQVANENCFRAFEISNEPDQLLKSISNDGDR